MGDFTIFIFVISFKPPLPLYHFEELKLLYHCITFSSFVGHIVFKSSIAICYVPVICIHGPHGAGDTGDICGARVCFNIRTIVWCAEFK